MFLPYKFDLPPERHFSADLPALVAEAKERRELVKTDPYQRPLWTRCIRAYQRAIDANRKAQAAS